MFDPWVGKIPWRRKWQPTPVLLPGNSHGRRSLVGYSPRGRKELDTTEQLHSLIPVKVIQNVKIIIVLRKYWDSLVAQMVKNLLAVQRLRLNP